MLTRHQFEEIAALIAKIDDKDVRYTVAMGLANVCTKSNPHFDRVKFMEAACEL